MNVYLWPHQALGRAMTRITMALAAHAPKDVRLVSTIQAADVVVHHVIGLRNLHPTTDLPELVKEQGKPYVVLQYCLRSTETADPNVWVPLWSGARAVWSYYDLESYARQDGYLAPGQDLPFRFYHAPLGVDGSVFQQTPGLDGRFLMATSGYVSESECVGECAQAVKNVGGKMFHLGPDLKLGEHVECRVGISDKALVDAYSQSAYVSGLRRGEGFELPMLEGLACGARPITFDQPHYRGWYGEHAEYVTEAEPAAVRESVEEILRKPRRAVTEAERKAVLRRFDWKDIADGFWEVCR